MKKIFFIFTSILIMSSLGYTGLVMVYPAVNDTILYIGEDCHLKWRWEGAPVPPGGEDVAVILEQLGTNEGWRIGESHTVADGGFTWKVGKLNDGSFLPPGKYEITFESPDSDTASRTIIIRRSRKSDKFIKEFHKIVNRIKVLPPPPECPKCIILDLMKLKEVVKDLKGQYEFQLFFKNRLISKLGQLGNGKMLPNSVKLSLDKDKITEFMKQGGNKFQLKLLGLKGNVIHTQDVKLEF